MLGGARNVYQRTGSADSIAEAIVKESTRGYDAIFAGASQTEGDSALGGEVLRELVRRTRVPVIITRNLGAPLPLRRVLVPTTGAPFARLGATVAILYADATSARLTSLYVKEGPQISLRNLYPRNSGAGGASADEAAPIVNEIRALAGQLGVDADVIVTAGSRPERAILAAAERDNFDLLIMGVQFRPAESGLVLRRQGRAHFAQRPLRRRRRVSPEFPPRS